MRKYIGITEAARLADVPRRTMLRRLRAINKEHPGLLTRESEGGTWRVDVQLLATASEWTPESQEPECPDMDGLDEALQALANEISQLSHRVSILESHYVCEYPGFFSGMAN